MIFIYLFVISIAGIILGIIIEHLRTKKTLLQILKSSCSIDSVKFEKQLETAKNTSYTFKKYIYSISHISVKKALSYHGLVVKKIKYSIRKKLHSDATNEIPSDFISQIKSD